ncbi:MAG: hypothetical protein JW703_03025 [Candidatus Diapherotrites archaeon]|nr:hypothetical protein [Candidatus Diapherotrites archaeon]
MNFKKTILKHGTTSFKPKTRRKPKLSSSSEQQIKFIEKKSKFHLEHILKQLNAIPNCSISLELLKDFVERTFPASKSEIHPDIKKYFAEHRIPLRAQKILIEYRKNIRKYCKSIHFE